MRRATRAIALLVLLASSALAQSRDPATADALFREARALMKKGDFASACPKLADSHRLDAAPGTAINLGDCLEKVGKLADALQAQRDALDLLSAGDKRIGPVKEQIASLEKRVPRLTIKLAPGAPTNTKVKRDDVELGEGSLGTALPVNPGEHWVTVVARGRADVRRKVVLREGHAELLDVSAGEQLEAERSTRLSEPAPTAASDESSDASSLRTVGYVVGALGVIGTGFGIVSYFDFKSKQSDANAICSGKNCAPEEKSRYEALKPDIDAAGSRAAWGIGLGLTAVAGGAALILLAPDDSNGKHAVRATPVVAARGLGFQLGGTW